MEDQNIVLFLDKIKKLLELGNKPKAIAEIDVASRRSERTFWGGPFSFNSQVMVEREITAGEWEEMLMSIRECFKSKGKVSTRESVLEWSSPWDSSNSAQVIALKEDGKTKISVFWNGPLTALPFYLPVPLAAIASLFIAADFLEWSALPGFSFVLLVSGLTFLTGRWALRRHLDKVFSKFRRMMAGFELISSKNDAKAEVVSNQEDVIQGQIVAHEPLLKLGEEEGSDELDLQAKNRDRS